MFLRPHHLLCTRAFKGNGYSPAFIENMYRIIDCIKNSNAITLIAGVDRICSACPERCGTQCAAEAKVTALDSATLFYFQLELRAYTYAELESVIESRLTEDIYNAVCGDCRWKQAGVCCYADVSRPLK